MDERESPKSALQGAGRAEDRLKHQAEETACQALMFKVWSLSLVL